MDAPVGTKTLLIVEDDTLTPTFQLTRPQLLKRYQAKVDELYAKLKK